MGRQKEAIAIIIIDRIDGDFAVCEIDGSSKNIPLSLIENNPCEGDVLLKTPDGYTADKKLTEKRRKAAAEKQKRLFSKNG